MVQLGKRVNVIQRLHFGTIILTHLKISMSVLFNISILCYNAECRSDYQCDLIAGSFLLFGYMMKAVAAALKKKQSPGLSMGHIYLSHTHPIAIYACPIPWDSHYIIIILIWNTIQLKLLNL